MPDPKAWFSNDLELKGWFGAEPLEYWFDPQLYSAPSGPVTLTQTTTYTDADTFYGGVVSSGTPQTVTQTSLFTDSDTFYTGTVTTRINGALYTDADTFYTGALSARISQSALYTDSDTYYTGSLAQGLSGALYSDPDTFYGGTVQVSTVVTQSALFDDGDTFYGGTVTGGNATPVVISGGNAQKEWENRQKYRQEAKRIIELLEPEQTKAVEPVTVALVEQVAPDFSLTKAIAEGMTLGLTIDPLMLAIEQKRANDAAEQARLLMALIEQEREAVAVAWFLAEVA